MQSSAEREWTCLLRSVTKVRRKSSCCSVGRDWSFARSSSGFSVGEEADADAAVGGVEVAGSVIEVGFASGDGPRRFRELSGSDHGLDMV